jgi:O-succinylbenzoate synthase
VLSPAITEFDRVTAWAINLPMHLRFTSARSQLENRRLILIKLEAGGYAGWGEAAPVPGHSTEELSAVWDGVRAAAAGLTRDPSTTVGGLAGAAISSAAADLQARTAALPLWRHLNGHGEVWASAAIGLDDDGQPDRDQLDQVAATGYRYAKLKITDETAPGLLQELAAEWPDVTLGLDANGSLGTNNLSKLQAIDELGFAFIEQPGAPEDLEGHHRIKKALTTPIALDEAAFSESAIHQILEQDAADIINLKVGRFGIVETLRLAQQITSSGCLVRLGGLIESGVGRAHSIALASRKEFTVVGDIAGSDLFYDHDLVDPSWRVTDGRLQPTDAPGIGVTVDEAAIERLAFDYITRG